MSDGEAVGFFMGVIIVIAIVGAVWKFIVCIFPYVMITAGVIAVLALVGYAIYSKYKISKIKRESTDAWLETATEVQLRITNPQSNETKDVWLFLSPIDLNIPIKFDHEERLSYKFMIECFSFEMISSSKAPFVSALRIKCSNGTIVELHESKYKYALFDEDNNHCLEIIKV